MQMHGTKVLHVGGSFEFNYKDTPNTYEKFRRTTLIN